MFDGTFVLAFLTVLVFGLLIAFSFQFAVANPILFVKIVVTSLITLLAIESRKAC
jgi:hypothetical protein